MKVELVLLITGLLILALGVSVFYDTQTTRGACEDVSNSVCTAGGSCPDGYVATLDYTCNLQEMTCCVPNTR